MLICDWHRFFKSIEEKSSYFTSTRKWIIVDKDRIVFSSVQLLSHVWLLATHESQHSRPTCPSPTPGVYSNSCPSSQWHHPAISSSVIPFSSCPQSFPASGSFQMSQLFSSSGQSIGGSASNISTSNEYPGLISFRMHWLDLLAV